MKLITICIPTYNQCEFLNKLLSQISKYNKNYPIIISDNGSTDKTSKIVLKYKNKLNNLKYLRLKKNYGFDYNYLNCIKKVKTNYFWVLGSDDQIYSNSINNIEKLLKFLNYPNGLTFIDNKNKIKRKINFNRISNFKLSRDSNNLGKICTNIIKKKNFLKVKNNKIKQNFGYIQVYYLVNIITRYKNWFIYENNIICKTNYFSKHIKSKYDILNRLDSEFKGYLKNIHPKKLGFNEYKKYKKIIFLKNIRPWIFSSLLINDKNDVLKIIKKNNYLVKDINNFQIIKKLIIFIPQSIIKIVLKLKLFLFND